MPTGARVLPQAGSRVAQVSGSLTRNTLADETEPTEPDKNLIETVFNGGLGKGEIDPATTQQTADTLMQAVTTGYAEKMGIKPDKLATADFDTPHTNMLANLEKNVYQFSAAKNHQQLRELTNALRDGDKRRSFADFKMEAMKILDTYNTRYLEAEYNTAQSGAYNAASWADYEVAAKLKGGQEKILLKFVTAGDDHVRASHAALDGIVRPMDDPFWDNHMPPLDWQCRCTTYQLTKREPVTPEENIPEISIPKLFRTNLAKQNLVFSEDHPYFKGAPDHIIEEGMKLLNKQKT